MSSPLARTTQNAGKIALGVLLAVGLSHCGKAPPAEPKPSQSLYAYDVALTLTPAAVSKLAGKKVVISGYYFGAPTEAAKDKVNEDGQIELGEDLVDVTASTQTVKLTGYGLDPAVLKSVEGGQPSVEVTAYSETTAKNGLKCTTFKDTVAKAQAGPIAISCDAAGK